MGEKIAGKEGDRQRSGEMIGVVNYSQLSRTIL